jgi:hypothetical protein
MTLQPEEHLLYSYKVKVKVTLEQATEVHRGSSGIAVLSSNSALEVMGGQRQASAALPSGKT